jgi:hypothetical protein
MKPRDTLGLLQYLDKKSPNGIGNLPAIMIYCLETSSITLQARFAKFCYFSPLMLHLVHQNAEYDGISNWWESDWFKTWLRLARHEQL